MSTQSPVSAEDIEKGLRIVAGLIEAYGDAYWPLFDRLENELERRADRAARLRRRLGKKSKTALPATSIAK